jgi:hypothetical protein
MERCLSCNLIGTEVARSSHVSVEVRACRGSSLTKRAHAPTYTRIEPAAIEIMRYPLPVLYITARRVVLLVTTTPCNSHWQLVVYDI